MPREKAVFRIDDIVVQVGCPACRNWQPSPGYPNSLGWDKSDAKKTGRKGVVQCESCGARFALPAQLFHLMEV